MCGRRRLSSRTSCRSKKRKTRRRRHRATRISCTEGTERGEGRRMDAKLIKFTHLLRQNGLKESAAEKMNTFPALGLTATADRQILKETRRATLVKRAA